MPRYPGVPTAPSKLSPQLEERARWAFQQLADHPTLTFEERIRQLRRHFAIGKTAAELAMKRCREMSREFTAEIVAGYRDHVIRASKEDEAAARAAGDYRTANRIRMDLARMLGMHAPDKVEHTLKPKVAPALPELTDEQLEALERAGVVAALAPVDGELDVDEDGAIDVEGVEVDASHGAAELVSRGDDEFVSATSDPDTVG